MVQFELHETNTNGDECVIRIAERRVSVSNQHEHAGYELLKIKNGKGKIECESMHACASENENIIIEKC